MAGGAGGAAFAGAAMASFALIGMSGDFNKAEAATVRVDPLVLDLNGDGAKVSGAAFFDLDCNGFAELTGWVSEEDGFLAIDKNNDGIINDGSELFGDQTILSNNTVASHGFMALADLDTNHDGVINASDEKFSQLYVIKGDDTVYTLSELGITALNLAYSNSNLTDEIGNTQIHIGTYTKTDNTTGVIGDFLLQRNTYLTTVLDDITIPEEIEALPNAFGTGNVYSLQQKMALDTTGELKALVQAFVNEENASSRYELLDQIIFKWIGVENIDPNSRGNFDARKLAVLETFLVTTYQDNPNSTVNIVAAEFLATAYTGLKENIYAQLMCQSHLKDLYTLAFTYDEVNEQIVFSLDSAKTEILNDIALNNVEGKQELIEFIRTLKTLGLGENEVYNEFKADLESLGVEYKNIFLVSNKALVEGTSGNDSLEGSVASEAIWGYDGNDTIYKFAA